MTDEEFAEFLKACPKLYHMAEHGSWPSIRQQGLLSTTALLDLYGITDEAREAIEANHRPKSVTIKKAGLPDAVIRDQIPMSDKALRKCLRDGLKPTDWYRLLNKRIFFWTSEKRLLRLLGARAYRNKHHDILEVDTTEIFRDFTDKIWLCPINSGSTIMNPVPRGNDTFLRIDDYPYGLWRKKRNIRERIVEVSIDYSAPNLRDYVTRVVEMKGDAIIKLRVDL